MFLVLLDRVLKCTSKVYTYIYILKYYLRGYVKKRKKEQIFLLSYKQMLESMEISS